MERELLPVFNEKVKKNVKKAGGVLFEAGLKPMKR
jgi:hypothetical protein